MDHLTIVPCRRYETTGRQSGRDVFARINQRALESDRRVSSKATVDIEFKWNDRMQKPGGVMDFYQSGDTAPGGRFNYRYRASGE